MSESGEKSEASHGNPTGNPTKSLLPGQVLGTIGGNIVTRLGGMLGLGGIQIPISGSFKLLGNLGKNLRISSF